MLRSEHGRLQYADPARERDLCKSGASALQTRQQSICNENPKEKGLAVGKDEDRKEDIQQTRQLVHSEVEVFFLGQQKSVLSA